MKPAKKAYQVNPSNLDCSHESVVRGYIYEPIIADNEREARKMALHFLDNDCGIAEDYKDDPLTYISVKVRRIPEHDRFLVDGKLKTREGIEYDRRKKENEDMLRKMLTDNPNGLAYIKKGGYYYGPNCGGYTEYRSNAGVYTMAKAVQECLGVDLRDFMRPVPIDIEEHNKMITEKIEDLKSKLIQTQS